MAGERITPAAAYGRPSEALRRCVIRESRRRIIAAVLEERQATPSDDRGTQGERPPQRDGANASEND